MAQQIKQPIAIPPQDTQISEIEEVSTLLAAPTNPQQIGDNSAPLAQEDNKETDKKRQEIAKSTKDSKNINFVNCPLVESNQLKESSEESKSSHNFSVKQSNEMLSNSKNQSPLSTVNEIQNKDCLANPPAFANQQDSTPSKTSRAYAEIRPVPVIPHSPMVITPYDDAAKKPSKCWAFKIVAFSIIMTSVAQIINCFI
jgi:hypothetical protein